VGTRQKEFGKLLTEDRNIRSLAQEKTGVRSVRRFASERAAAAAASPS